MKFRFFLFPLAFFYGTIIHIRNFLFDIQLFKSNPSTLPSIVIGNLSMGGNGKTPTLLWLYEVLKDNHNIAFLSRGYGRNTKGFRQVSALSTAKEVGDEPLLLYSKTQNPFTFVCENRFKGIEKIKNLFPKIDLVILDDAFQHRKLKADKYILLTEYDSPFFNDFYFPMGNLRDGKNQAKRADIIIVSKCPNSLQDTEKEIFIKKINPLPHQSVFFSTIEYEILKEVFENKNVSFPEECIAVSGIANPKLFIEAVSKKTKLIKHFNYPDHHSFSEKDIDSWSNTSNCKAIITTEKDAIRLIEYKDYLDSKNLKIFSLPIKIQIDNLELFLKILNSN
jgi:tetraacyldisaccharide 4'-kinase